MLNKLKSIGTTAVHFLAGTYVYTAKCTRKFTKPIIDAGKREMCKEPLHDHHDGCPACDIDHNFVNIADCRAGTCDCVDM